MEDKVKKLEQIINGENPEEQRHEIFLIITTIYGELQSNKWDVTPHMMTVLNNSAEYLFDLEMKNLLKQPIYLGWRYYLFVLAANYLINLDDILYETATNSQKLKDELKIPDPLVRKLVSQFETRSELIRHLPEGRNEGRMSETLRSIHVSYPSLRELRSASWRTIKELIIQKPSQPDHSQSEHLIQDTRLIQQLWSSQSELRQLIFDNSLPLELADDIEKCKVPKLIDLTYKKYEELSQSLTTSEKNTFEKLYNKETSFSAARARQESILKKELNDKLIQAEATLEKIQNQDKYIQQNLNLKELPEEQVETLFFNGIEEQVLSLEEVGHLINLAKQTLSISTTPFETDEDLIAEINGGLALHCFSYGLSDDALCKLAPEPFFQKPKICLIKDMTTIHSKKFEEYCFSKEEVIHLKNIMIYAGSSFYDQLKARGFGFNGKACSSQTLKDENIKMQSCHLTLLTFKICPMATFRINREQLTLSRSAISNLKTIEDVSSAEIFLDRYGSHFSCGSHHLGGVLCHSVELTAEEKQTESTLKTLAKKEMETSTYSGYENFLSTVNRVKSKELIQENSEVNMVGKITSRSETTAFGPPALQPRLFEELLQTNSHYWHIIDRGVSAETLVPIWIIVAEKHPVFKPAADLMRKAWLRRTAHIEEGIVKIEWEKIKNREQTNVNDEMEQQLISFLNNLKNINIETVEESVLLEKLTLYFQTLQTLEYQCETSSTLNKTNQVSYWISYVAKQKNLFLLLNELSGRWKLKDIKFQQVFRYLSSIITKEKIEEMEHAGYELNKEICEMLQCVDQKGQHEESFKATLVTTNIENLVKVLRKEFNEHQNSVNQVSDLQWNIQTILASALKNTTEKDSKIKNVIEDFLVKDYGWKNNSFAGNFSISREGFSQMFEKIEYLQRQQRELKSDLAVNKRVPEDTDQSSEKNVLLHQPSQKNSSTGQLHLKPSAEPFKRSASQERTDSVENNYSPVQLPTPAPLPRRQPRSRKNIMEKKPYAALLIDRPLNKIREDKTIYLKSCLRYRMQLPTFSTKISNDKNADGDEGIDDFLLTFQQATNNSSRETVIDKSTAVSLYDTLLDLIDEFDAAGKEEIFRLLLERRSAIPLFIPDSNSNHLMLLQDIAKTLSISSKTINMGKDKSLGRVAIVSCRNISVSQTPELLANLFHIESLHRLDFAKGCITEYSTTAEIAFGCIPSDAIQQPSSSKIQHFLVLHVVGEFEPIMPFIKTFADYLLIEDSVDGASRIESITKGSFYRSALLNQKDSLSSENQDYLNEASANLAGINNIALCRQSTGAVITVGSVNRFCIDGPFGDKIFKHLKTSIRMTFDKNDLVSLPNRMSLCEMHLQLPQNCGSTMTDYLTPWNFDNLIINYKSRFADIREKEFILQKSYQEQSVHEENKWEFRLDEERKKKEDKAIDVYISQRKKDAKTVMNHPFLKGFQEILTHQNSCVRVLAIRQLERAIASRSDMELDQQRKELQHLYERFGELSSLKTTDNTTNDKELEKVKKVLTEKRMKFNKSVLSMEHLWREFSHLYTADNLTYFKLPQLAAQHLFDGFSIELLDGDSNLVNLQWMEQVLTELCKRIDKARQRIFVLSIMGVQSSGKSTLLNTMFGIQMRTSVGMCTRGVNMQLLAVEGRPEYDYILILDTEGTRAPEYHGLEGSEKRDNKMATLSILLADATIIVNPGENDAAIKEILPIVLMAYQGSNLAEDNGGRLSNMMFFVYNRIDTTQKDKLSTIIQTLSTSLNDAFDAVQNKIIPTGFTKHISGTQQKWESPFRNFKLDATNSSESDVRILGNVKEKYEAPADVPDPAYGEALAEFREHIHRRVTSPRGENSTVQWKPRSLHEFAKYLDDVWKCIGSANFTLHFASIMERSNFDKLEIDYKKCEQDLAQTYQDQFREVQKSMIKERGTAEKKSATNETKTDIGLLTFERSMQQMVNLKESRLDQEVEDIVNQRGREKWKIQYQERWKRYKESQNSHWKGFLKASFEVLFTYDSQVEKFKKDMRQQIRNLFSLPDNNAKEWTESRKKEEFEKMYVEILREAKTKFPEVDVEQKIKDVYKTNTQMIDERFNSLDNKRIESEYEALIDFQLKSSTQGSRELFYQEPGLVKRCLKYMFSPSSNQKEPKAYEKSIFSYIMETTAGKVCYDDSIGDEIIKKTINILQQYQRETGISLQNNEKEKVHIYARTLAIHRLRQIQKDWNLNNSVYEKLNLKSNRTAMWEYFLKASEGVESTKLFICLIKSILNDNLAEAFEKEIIYSTTNAIRNEKWLNNGKFMQNHVDLYLIKLLDDGKLHDVLDFISHPQELYRKVLKNLIASKVPEGEKEYQKFIQVLKKQILQAISLLPSVESGRAAYFVETLRNGCVTILLSPCLGEKLLINCRGEYDDCDKEDPEAFMKSCEIALLPIVDKFVGPLPNNQGIFANALSSKIVEYMKTQNDATARPRCDVSCPWCGSQCLDTANHDTKFQLHDTIHQPSGLNGIKDKRTLILDHLACGKYEDSTNLSRGDKVLGKFEDFETIFPGWKKPKWRESWPLREYIFATYQEDIVKRYQHGNVKECCDIPAEYKRELSTIRENLEKEIQNLEVN